MQGLSNSQLVKFLNGERRWQIFLRHYLFGEEFILSPKGKERFGTDTIKLRKDNLLVRNIQQAVESDNFSTLSKIRFESVDGKEISLSDLGKTPEFGSTKGLGGGTEQTMWVEAGQCVVCAAKIIPEQLSELTETNIDTSRVSLQGGLNIEDVLVAIKALDSKWHTALIEIAKGLRNYFPEVYVFRYHDSFVRQVEKTFNSLRKETEFSNINKWNPADIWVTEPGFTLPEFKSFVEFNSFLCEACKSKKAVGVSLKKVSDKPEIDFREYKSSLGKIEIVDVTYPKENTETGTIRFSVNGSEKDLVLRKNSTLNLRAEVKGVGQNLHRAGGCGKKVIQKALQVAGIEDVSIADLQYWKEKLIEDQDTVNHPGNYSEDRVREAESRGAEMTLNEEQIPKHLLDKKACYYAVTETLKILEDTNSLLPFVKYLYNFCISNSELSCSFVKVH